MVMRPCLEAGCPHLGLNAPRCPAHTAERLKVKNYRRSHAPGDGAARRVRSGLSSFMAARCASCQRTHPMSEIEVDHRVPLADGGLDVDANLQLLCKGCHRDKTRGEGLARRQRS